MREAKAPALQWYPGDWQRDSALRSCSLAARGLWSEMLWTMHDGQPRGYLRAGARRLDSVAVIARMAGAGPDENVAGLLAELEEAGVFSRDDGGTIFCRRMVRDTKLQDVRREAGAKGGATTQEKLREMAQRAADKGSRKGGAVRASKKQRRTEPEPDTKLAAAKAAGLEAVRGMRLLHSEVVDEALEDIRGAKTAEEVDACVSTVEQLSKRAEIEAGFASPSAAAGG